MRNNYSIIAFRRFLFHHPKSFHYTCAKTGHSSKHRLLCLGRKNYSTFNCCKWLNRVEKWNCSKVNYRLYHSKSESNTDREQFPIDAQVRNRVCTTYATADHYRFTKLVKNVSLNGRFQRITLPIDAAGVALFSTSDESVTNVNDNGYVVLFKDGAISFWNISNKVATQFLDMAQLHEEESYKRKMVQWEKEEMEYRLVSTETRLHKSWFEISSTTSIEQTCCEIFAFSNALMTSVKLAHWEQSLDSLIQSIEFLPRELMKGKYLRSYTPQSVLSKIGEILMIRTFMARKTKNNVLSEEMPCLLLTGPTFLYIHRLNLKYNVLDVPDVYWDEEDLENLYVKTTQFLNIEKRVKVMNEKLTYCAHVVELVKSHMAEQKSIRIEILIVLLILIEVLFEVIHFYVKPYLEKRRNEKFKNKEKL